MFGQPLPPRRSAGGAGGRHRHGAPAFHARRKHERAGEHRARHRGALAPRSRPSRGAGADRAARPAISDLPSTRIARSAALSVGERQRVEILKALYRDARDPDPRRADRGADAAARPRRCFATLTHARRARACRSSSSPTSSPKSWPSATASWCCAAAGSSASATTGRTDRAELAALMVGRKSSRRRSRRRPAGRPVLELEDVSTPARGAGAGLERCLARPCARGEITGSGRRLRQRPGGAGRIAVGHRAPGDGPHPGRRPAPRAGRRARHLAMASARIPEDRHAIGTIGDMTRHGKRHRRALSLPTASAASAFSTGRRPGAFAAAYHRRL